MKIFQGTPKRKRATFVVSVATVAALSMTPLVSGVSLAESETGRNLLAMLGARSPGERPDGALLDTKLRKTALAAAPAPHEYALPKTRERVEPSVPFTPEPVIPAGTSAYPLSQASSVPGPQVYSPGVPFVSGPTPGPGPVGRPDTPTPPGPTNGPDPVSAVPEPAAWLNMIIGFGAIATILRARRRRQGALQPQLAKVADARSDG